MDTGGAGVITMPDAPVSVVGGLAGQNSGCAEKIQD